MRHEFVAGALPLLPQPMRLSGADQGEAYRSARASLRQSCVIHRCNDADAWVPTTDRMLAQQDHWPAIGGKLHDTFNERLGYAFKRMAEAQRAAIQAQGDSVTGGADAEGLSAKYFQ